MPPEIRYTPFDPELRSDPYPAYARLRQHAPVYHCEADELYAISRYDDVLGVLKQPDLFSSSAMSSVQLGIRPGQEGSPESMQKGMAIANVMPFAIEDLAGTSILIACDPPRHEVMRRIVNRGFTPRRIAPVEERVRQLAANAMAKLRDRHSFDLVADLAIPVPVIVIAEMLGVEPERQEDFKRWSDAIIRGATGSGRDLGIVEGGMVPAMGEFAVYFKEVYERRKREPRDDLVSLLIRAEDEAESLNAIEVVLFALLLLVAGNETTTNAIVNTTNALLDNPDQLERVRADRTLLPALVEEGLRYESPVQTVFRRATRDVEIAGTRIPESAHVMCLIGSANRDEAHWGGDAGRFDVARNSQGHLAFGFGIHFCLGAALARLEARVALDAILDDLPRVRKRDDSLEFVDSYLIRGLERLELQAA